MSHNQHNHPLVLIGGARPNFMKLAPLAWELKRRKKTFSIVNTGQHFSSSMSEQFIREFDLHIDHVLTPSDVSVVQQITDIMKGLEVILRNIQPRAVIVVGDVNSTLAGALVANKLGITLAHVEAGLRSHNRVMPEEHNRVMVDHISDLLFVTQEEGKANLHAEGITEGIHVVGNIMVDTLTHFEQKVSHTGERFYFLTLHRAENVDRREVFSDILDALTVIAQDEKIYLPLHPRTKLMAERFNLINVLKKTCTLLPPLSYAESLFYQKNALLVFTDSGGVQEETSYLGTPCITLRTETERPITISHGTNTIGGTTRDSILEAYHAKKLVHTKTHIPLWDGSAARRIVDVLEEQTVN